MDDTPLANDHAESSSSDSTAAPRAEALTKVCEQQDRAREVLRRKLGQVNVAVDLVREVRGVALK